MNRLRRSEPVTSVVISVELAELISRVFLPKNPNKMRGADPAVVQAVKDFRTELANAMAWKPA